MNNNRDWLIAAITVFSVCSLARGDEISEQNGSLISDLEGVSITSAAPALGASEAWQISVDPAVWNHPENFNLVSGYLPEPAPDGPGKINFITQFAPSSSAPGAPWIAIWYSDIPNTTGITSTSSLNSDEWSDAKGVKHHVEFIDRGDSASLPVPDSGSTMLLAGFAVFGLIGVVVLRQ